MGNKDCARYESEGVVCPPKLNKKVFTTATVDNIDHNPNSTTAQRAFHGTGISLFQDPSENITGEERDVINVENTSKKRLSQLPESYTTVQPVIIPKKEPPVPTLQGPSHVINRYLQLLRRYNGTGQRRMVSKSLLLCSGGSTPNLPHLKHLGPGSRRVDGLVP